MSTDTLSAETREKLSTVSTATLTTQMYKRGFRNVFMQGVGRLTTAHDRNMVGPAFTLRYIPAREDLDDLSVFQDYDHPQRKAIETCPEGHVLVMDSRGDPSAEHPLPRDFAREVYEECADRYLEFASVDGPSSCGSRLFPADKVP